MEIFEIKEYSSGGFGDHGRILGYELAEDSESAKQQYADKHNVPNIMESGFVQPSKISRVAYLEKLREAHRILDLYDLPKQVELDIEREMLIEYLKGVHIRTLDDLFNEVSNYFDNHLSVGGVQTNNDDGVMISFKRSGHKFILKIKLNEVKI